MPNTLYNYHTGELMHYQVKGAKHGVRRYQYEDGTYTPLGREHYGIGPPRGSGVETGAEKIARKYKSAKESFHAYRVKKKRQQTLERNRKAKAAKKAEEERVASEKRAQEERIEKSKRDKVEYEAEAERLRAESAKESAEAEARRAIDERRKEEATLLDKELPEGRDKRYENYTNTELKSLLERKQLENALFDQDKMREATDAERAEIKRQGIERGKAYLQTAYDMAVIGYQSYQLLNAYKQAKAGAKDGNTASFNVNVQNKQTTTTKNGQTTQTKNGQQVQQNNQQKPNNQNQNQQKPNNNNNNNQQKQNQQNNNQQKTTYDNQGRPTSTEGTVSLRLNEQQAQAAVSLMQDGSKALADWFAKKERERNK